MSKTINPIISSSGMKSEIHATGIDSTGSVTCTIPSGTTKTATYDSTNEYWVVDKLTELGTYTVTGTQDEDTDTKELVISTVGIYAIEFAFVTPVEYDFTDSDQLNDFTIEQTSYSGVRINNGYASIYANSNDNQCHLFYYPAVSGYTNFETRYKFSATTNQFYCDIRLVFDDITFRFYPYIYYFYGYGHITNTESGNSYLQDGSNTNLYSHSWVITPTEWNIFSYEIKNGKTYFYSNDTLLYTYDGALTNLSTIVWGNESWFNANFTTDIDYMKLS